MLKSQISPRSSRGKSKKGKMRRLPSSGGRSVGVVESGETVGLTETVRRSSFIMWVKVAGFGEVMAAPIGFVVVGVIELFEGVGVAPMVFTVFVAVIVVKSDAVASSSGLLDAIFGAVLRCRNFQRCRQQT